MELAARILLVPLLLLASTGCDAMEETEAAEPLEPLVVTVDTDRSPPAPESNGLRTVGTLTSISPSGAEITLSVHPDPPGPGPLRLDFALPRGWTPTAALSVDVVAPRMPAHGIVRYPVPASDGDRASVEVVIPMEGVWAIYLNLDHGPDAAAFEIQVEGDTPDPRDPTRPQQHHDQHHHHDQHDQHEHHDQRGHHDRHAHTGRD
jgi:hypothetical protein